MLKLVFSPCLLAFHKWFPHFVYQHSCWFPHLIYQHFLLVPSSSLPTLPYWFPHLVYQHSHTDSLTLSNTPSCFPHPAYQHSQLVPSPYLPTLTAGSLTQSTNTPSRFPHPVCCNMDIRSKRMSISSGVICVYICASFRNSSVKKKTIYVQIMYFGKNTKLVPFLCLNNNILFIKTVMKITTDKNN